MFKLLSAYCLILLASFAFAQIIDAHKISGTVVSSNSGEPIPYGIIMIGTDKAYKCDISGRFTSHNLQQGHHKLSFNSFGYDKKDTIVTISNTDIDNFIWSIYTECSKYSKEIALDDIKAKKPKILLQSGIAPIVYSSDTVFESKYEISFHDLGCVADDEQECLIAYNKTIFAYLDETYGKKWRRKIRKDAIGLKNK